MPRPALLDEMNAGFRRADQLAVLRQDPPLHESVHSWARRQASGGINTRVGEGIWNSALLKQCSPKRWIRYYCSAAPKEGFVKTEIHLPFFL